MEVKIIDRTEKEKNKSYEQAFADGIGMTIKEVRDARKEIKEMEKEVKEAEEKGITLSITPTTSVGKVMFYSYCGE